jgi:hypothetical protein
VSLLSDGQVGAPIFELQCALSRVAQARDKSEKRRLSSAVRAGDFENFSAPDRETDSGEHGPAAALA